MYVIGLFSELDEKNSHLRSIADFVNQLSISDQQLVLSYLHEDAMVMCWMGLTRDPLSPDGHRVYGPSVCSDTQWIWRQDLRYFVDRYRIGLPEAFLKHVRAERGIYRTTEADRIMHFDQIMATYNAARKGSDALQY